MINREGYRIIAAAFLVALAPFLLNFYWISAVLLVPFFFTLFFFRDPERVVTKGKNILAPADGKVIQASQGVVHIFMSPFNVHLTRMPVKGTVKSIRYRKGKFGPAYKKGSEKANESNRIEIKSKAGTLYLTQIAGFVARRIVCWAEKGEAIEKGKRIGIIKFGSGVRLEMPKNIKLRVKEGDMVKGGVTVLAHY